MFEPALHASRAQRISLVAGAILACMIVPREGRASWGATVTQDRSTFLSNRTQLETITFDNLSVGPHDPIIATYGRVQNGSGGTLNVVQNAQATSPPNVVTEFGSSYPAVLIEITGSTVSGVGFSIIGPSEPRYRVIAFASNGSSDIFDGLYGGFVGVTPPAGQQIARVLFTSSPAGYNGTVSFAPIDDVLFVAGGSNPCTLGCTAIVPTTGSTMTPVQFLGSASLQNCTNPASYEWSFGDSSANTTVQNPQHLYQNTGTYPWTLMVSTSGATPCTRNGSITIGVSTPVITTFSANPPTINTGQSTTLSWSTSNATTVSIDHGIGVVASTGSIPVNPNTTTTYTLTASNTAQQISRQVTVTVITSCTLTATASVPKTGIVNTPISFAATASTTGSCPTPTYMWTFNDQSAPTGVRNPVHTYGSPGPYTWDLSVTAGTQTVHRSDTITITPPGSSAPPLLFVYGYCGDTTTWNVMTANLNSRNVSRYPLPRVDLYFDGTQVRVYGTNSPTIPVARMYGIVYYDASSKTFESTSIYNIHIQALGYQLQRVIAAILNVQPTAKQVDIVAHSMGGLVARSFVEGIAANNPTSGFVSYDNSVRAVITLDTPHRGTAGPSWDKLKNLVCVAAANTTQRIEMDPSSASDFLARINALQIPASVNILAVTTTSESCPVLGQSCFLLPEGDGVVSYEGQDPTCQAAQDVGDTTCHSIYDCQLNVGRYRNVSPFVDHSAVHDDPAIAKLIDAQLTNPATRVSCTKVPAGSTVAVAAPTSAPATVTVVASFTTLSSGKQALAACSADVVVLRSTGEAIATATVLAAGTQTADLGLITANDWHIEVRPDCDVQVTADVTAIPVFGRHRAAAH